MIVLGTLGLYKAAVGPRSPAISEANGEIAGAVTVGGKQVVE